MGFRGGEPLSIATCRQLVECSCAHLSDAEVERLRDQLYDIAAQVVLAYDPAQKLFEDADAALHLVTPNDRENIEERAAILEFDAQMTRDTATRISVAAHVRRSGLCRPEGPSH